MSKENITEILEKCKERIVPDTIVDEFYDEREERIQQAFKDMQLDQIPSRFKDATFDNFVCKTDKHKMAVDFLKKGKSIALYGKNGTGKTHLAFATLRHLVNNNKGKKVKYILAFELFDMVRNSFNDI